MKSFFGIIKIEKARQTLRSRYILKKKKNRKREKNHRSAGKLAVLFKPVPNAHHPEVKMPRLGAD